MSVSSLPQMIISPYLTVEEGYYYLGEEYDTERLSLSGGQFAP